jgi:cell shape-determining protein MreC
MTSRLVVMNVGSKQGVKRGMPFQVIRGGKIVGSVASSTSGENLRRLHSRSSF